MKTLILFLIAFSIQAQTIQLFWDFDGDKSADLTYSCDDGDTLTAYLYMVNADTSITADYPIYDFELPIIYGYYTRWSSNSDYSNIITVNSVVFDTTALMLDSSDVPVFSYNNNSSLRRMNISFNDTNDVGIVADSCIAIFTFIVSGTGTQILQFNRVALEDNHNVFYNTVVLNEKRINYDLWVRNCVITSE